MLPLIASRILVVEGVADDPYMRARAERLHAGIQADEVLHVDDAQLAAIIRQGLSDGPRVGMKSDLRPIVLFNRFRLDDDEDTRRARLEAYPELGRLKYGGYGGFDWRESGSAEYRRKTGLVCQPAWQLHTIVGCHFRCAYCGLGRLANIMLNMEDFVSRLDESFRRCPGQTLFQYDNFTDTVCFEPEYGGAKLLVEYFARQTRRALELYVGKSDHVDFLLDYDHRGRTVCCWSVGSAAQCRDFEYRAAPMAGRIEAMRKCQAAGYPVRVRFSPIIPVANWREENRRMIEQLFASVRPDVATIETIRFLDYDEMGRRFDLSLLDGEFVELMRQVQGRPVAQGCEVPDEYRKVVYQFMLDEIQRHDPRVPVAFCRERRELWEHFADRLGPLGQTPDRYVCNCGPYSCPDTVAAWRP